MRKAYIEQGLLCDVSDVLDKKEHYTNLAFAIYEREAYICDSTSIQSYDDSRRGQSDKLY